MLVFVAVATVVVLLNRRAMFTHENAATEVLVPGDEPARPQRRASAGRAVRVEADQQADEPMAGVGA
jgi:hypothetical protein